MQLGCNGWLLSVALASCLSYLAANVQVVFVNKDSLLIDFPAGVWRVADNTIERLAVTPTRFNGDLVLLPPVDAAQLKSMSRYIVLAYEPNQLITEIESLSRAG